ncbi:hypothetical protein MBH78_19170 [Oceanimonas sp. NS1]|nr:hypothetical protein [Oceanimonas sp. NS1]
MQTLVDTNSAGLVLLSNRAALVVNAEGRVSGITVTAGSQASAVDFLADFVSFTDPETLERNLYWDNTRKTLVVKGELRLLDGTNVSSVDDIRAHDGDTIYTEFQYSVNGSTAWHAPMATGDVFVRSRTVTNGTAGTWSAAARIKGDQGVQGTAGSGIYRMETATGVFPSDTATASSLFAGHVGRSPSRMTF